MAVAFAPAAHAAEHCTFNWGIKQSYRNYIQGPVAKGGWGADGIGFTGSETGPDGAFVFTPKKTEANGNSVTFNFNGTLKFNGHGHHGKTNVDLLDMTISDWKVRAEGNRADIIVDYVSYDSDMADTSKRGPQITGDDVAIATINLQNPVDSGTSEVNLAGTTNLTSEGQKLFLAYDAGQEMDPTSGAIKTDGSCDSASGSGGSGSGGTKRTLNTIKGNFTGFNKEIMSLLQESNDTLNAFTTFMGNSQAFLDEYESYQKRFGGGAGTGGNGNTSGGTTSGGTRSGGGTSNSAQSYSGGAGGHSGGTGGTGGGSTAGAGGASNTAGGGGTGGVAGGNAGDAHTGGAGEQCHATGVTSSTLGWGLKKSFRSYITGSIAKGSWTLQGSDYVDGQYRFSGNTGNVDTGAKTGSIRHNGAVQFDGHHGVLDLNVANPEVTFNGNSGQLLADVRSSTMEGEKLNFGRVVVADLQFDSLNVDANKASGKARAFLTDTGAKAFAGFYEPGMELDPLNFDAQLGGAGDCSAAGGASGSGTAGGASGSGTAGGTGKVAGGGTSNVAGGADNPLSGDGETTGYENGSGNFKIKSAGANNNGVGENPSTYILLLLAGLIVAGGSMSHLVMRNPA
ncbi:HtaA domain-containing protein [Corynebacterium propinquum]